jgi:hypothetical protein
MRLALQALRRPTLWWPLLAAGWRFRARGWLGRAPFLPLPSAAYMEWRLHTAYGEEGRAPTIEELGRYLRWVLRMNRLDRHR